MASNRLPGKTTVAAIAAGCVLAGSLVAAPAFANDATAPKLVAFDSAHSVDVTLETNPLVVNFKATDDQSGVLFAGARAYGPSGQVVEVNFRRNSPSTSVTGVMLSYNLPAFLEPGTYVFKSAYVGDVNYNYGNYDEAALAVLGRSTFVVKNTKGFDAVPPTLVRGKVLTPVVSLSSHHPGTDKALYVTVSLTAADTGNTVVAGVRTAIATFCQANKAYCIDVYSSDSAAPREPTAKLTLGTQVSAYYLAGDYSLYQVQIFDYAANRLVLTSTAFGGETDFGLYFPSTSLTLTP